MRYRQKDVTGTMRIGEGLLHLLVRNITAQDGRLMRTLRNLTSGLRVNTAADDASSLGRSERFRARIYGTRQALLNLNKGFDLIGVADSAVREIRDLLHRARELAVQSANGVLTDGDRAYLQTEITHIRKAIDDIARNTYYNNMPLFGYNAGFDYTSGASETFAGAGGTASNSALIQNGNLQLNYTTRNLFTDTFASTANIHPSTTATVDTGGGRVLLPYLIALAASDGFSDNSKVNTALTTALLNTSAGLVELSKIWTPRLTDTFTSTAGTDTGTTTAQVDTVNGLVQQPFIQNTLWTDSFTSLTNVDPVLNEALIDTALGIALLPTEFNVGIQDTFTDTTKTDIANTDAVIDTLAGLVKVGQSFNLWKSDTFTDTTQVDPGTTATVDTVNGWATLPVVNSPLWTDTFSNLTFVDPTTDANVDTGTGDVTLPVAYASAKTDTFADTTQTNTALTTALVNTALGLVQLNQVYNLVQTDTFADSSKIASNTAYLDTTNQWVTLPVVSNTLWSDTFGDTSLINTGITDAYWDSTNQKYILPVLFGTGKFDTFADSTQVDAGGTSAYLDLANQLVEMSRVLNSRYTNSFTSATGTDGGLTTASLDTVNGWVTAGTTTQNLKSDTFSSTAGTNTVTSTASVDTVNGWVQMPGTPPTTIALGSDSFTNLTNIGAGTTVTVDTGSGTAYLGTENWTVATDSFTTTTQVDTGNTTANVDTVNGLVELNGAIVAQTIATETFTDTTNLNLAQTSNVTVSGGVATLSQSYQTVATDTFATSTQIDWGQSNDIYVNASGQVAIGPPSPTSNVFDPGSQPNGKDDSAGVYSTGLVDTGTELRMYYVTAKQANTTEYVAYVYSTDGGLTWIDPSPADNAAGQILPSITGTELSDELDVIYEGGTYTMFISRENGLATDGIYVSTSADGINWTAPTQLTITGAPAYTTYGRPTIVNDGSTYHLFYETETGIEHATSTSLTSGWTDLGGWTNLSGTEPQIVDDGAGYTMYFRDTGTGDIYQRTSTDLITWTAPSVALTKAGTGWATNELHVGGVVYDNVTGVTRMLYYGNSAPGEYAVGMNYLQGNPTWGKMVTTVLNSTDTIQTVRLNATEVAGGGTISYRFSVDGGTTWTAITNGGTVTVAPGQGLLLEATLNDGDSDLLNGPFLDAYTLEALLYNSPGQVTSNQYTFATAVDNITLNVSETEPAGTTTTYYYSTDGTTWNVITPGSNVSLGTPSTTFYVRAELSTTDKGFTPTIDSWTLTTDVFTYNTPEQVYTQNYTFTDSIDSFNLAATQDTSNGTSINWEYSTDGGTTWLAASLGANSIGSPTQQLKLRATLNASADQLFTPTLYDYTVTASRHTSPQVLYSTNYTFAQAVNKIDLSTTQNLPAGTGIAYEVSIDGGTSWMAITPGSTLDLGATTTTQVQLRATFTSTDRYYTPTLSDYALTGTTVGYPTTSEWYSTASNPGYTVQNVTLNVTENNDLNSSIAYEISTDGGTTWESITPGSTLNLANPGSNLVLKAILSSTDPASTPRLLDYTLTTDVYDSSSQWVSSLITTPYDATAVKITALETKPAGTDITYEVSTDNGSTWTSVTNGVITNVTAGSNLRIRATLTTTDPNVTARLEDIQLETYDYDTSDTFLSTVTTTSTLTNQVRLQAAENLGAGTDILYEVTNDGGTTWIAVNPGDTATFGTLDNRIAMRATLTGTGAFTPQLLDYTLEVPGYQSDKYVYSTVQTSGSPVTNVTLTANEVTPLGTGITYEVSTDGGTSWTAVTNGVNTIVPSGTNLVFRAFLESTDAAFTPELLDYSIATNVSQSGSQLVTSTTNLATGARYLRLSVNEDTPAGTDIIYELSNDGGATWVAATPGTDVDMGAYGTQVLMRATFNTTDPQNLIVPTLFDYTIEAKEYATSQVFYSDYSAVSDPVTEVRLQANANALPAGTNILYEVTNDGGTTWMAVTPGNSAIFGSPGSLVGLRATLTSDGRFTPELLDYTLEIPGYTPGKYLYSTNQTFGTPITNFIFDANETLTANSSITYEYSVDNGATWNAIVTEGVVQALSAPSTQLKFRARLDSTDPSETPTLHDYSFTTNVDQSGKQLITTVTTATQPVRWLRLNATENKPAGTDITYELSNDGGTTWVAATPGTVVDMGAAGTQLMMRATFSTTDPTRVSVPQLLDYSIESYDYDPLRTFQSTVRTLVNSTNQLVFSVNDNQPAGTSINYFASFDGGITWEGITAGLNSLGHSGTDLVFKAEFATDGLSTPELYDYTIEVPGYDSPKYFYSNMNALGSTITNVKLQVADDQPAGTSITYQVSGDGVTWQTITPGADTVLTAATNQLQLRALMTSSDPNFTPSILDYTLTSNEDTSGSVWYSTVQALAAPAKTVRFSVNDDIPTGSNILYEFTADGVNWQTITPDVETTVTNPGTNLQLRATFTETDLTNVKTARLFDYTLESMDYATDQIMYTTITSLLAPTNQVKLEADEVKPGGTNIAYEVSLNGGTTWEAVTPGVTTTLGHSGDQMLMRARLTSTGDNTPQLLGYRLYVPGYETPKMVYSTVQAAAATIYNAILTTNATLPAGTSISYSVSSDGGGTWTGVTPGTEELLANPGSQLMLRAMLSTSAYNVTPELLDWTATTNDYSTTAETWESITYNYATPVDVVRLDASINRSSHTNVTFEVSNDNGLTWVTTTPGEDVFFDNPGTQLKMRVTMQSPTGGQTATIDQLDLYVRDSDPTFLPRQFWLQSGPIENEGFHISIDAVESAALGVDRVSVAKQYKAVEAMQRIDKAIVKLASISTSLGAAANRIEYSQNYAMVAQETLTAAESVIRDADMAYETTNLLKSQIMLMGATAVLDRALATRRQQLVVLLSSPNLLQFNNREPNEETDRTS